MTAVTFDIEFPLILAAIIALLATGGATALITQWFERRNRSAEAGLADAQATDVLVKAGKTAVEILTEQLNRALVRIEALETAVDKKDARIAHLEEQEREKDTRIRNLEEHVGNLEKHITRLEERNVEDDADA
jgi:hypothetical protein